MADKVTDILVEGLKQAMAEPDEQRLFRSGKFAGLFATRGGLNAQAAARALQDGLLAVTRSEMKGKLTVEWVRLTPRGVDFVHDHESPVKALRDLRQVLQAAQDGVPAWLGQVQQDLHTLAEQMTQNARRWTQRLEALGQRVEEALRRAEADEPPLPNGVATSVPWAREALAYLDRRRVGGVAGQCPLPELFAALRQRYPDLAVNAFHDGLRRLCDRRALQLVPFTGPSQELPEPEYALLDGGTVLYYATR